MGITGARGGIALQSVGKKNHGMDRRSTVLFVNGFTSGAGTKEMFGVVGPVLLNPKQK